MALAEEEVKVLQEKLNAMHRRAQAAEAMLKRVRDQAVWEGFLMGRNNEHFIGSPARQESALDALLVGAHADAWAQGHAEGWVAAKMEYAGDRPSAYHVARNDVLGIVASGWDFDQVYDQVANLDLLESVVFDVVPEMDAEEYERAAEKAAEGLKPLEDGSSSMRA